MSEGQVRIFISYARNDDLRPPGGHSARGFVTALKDELEYELTKQGEPRPALWWDLPNVEDGDQFDPLIEQAIEDSSLFVVVLSRNWLSRPYCRKELELFRSRWNHEDNFTFLHRIVVVLLNEVDETKCPRWVKGQTGYKFYKFEGKREPGNESIFFDRGEVRDNSYIKRVQDLSSFLWRRSIQVSRRGAVAEVSVTDPINPAAESQSVRSKTGLVIYLAVPANDMREPYNRLVKELAAWGHKVVPDPGTELPDDEAAIKLFDDALASASFSIHLLGEKRGFALNDDGHHSIVPLQLDRALQRVAAHNEFRRLIWAPKILAEGSGDSEDSPVRDPAAVVEKFGASCESDSIVGDSLSKFVDFLGPNLARSLRAVTPADAIRDGVTIYVNHRPEDEEYAAELARLLKRHKAQPVLRALDGEPEELLRSHRDSLRQCDSVVVCWAAASEVAARGMWQELEDWREIGRAKEFSRRGLIAGPPPGPRKKKVDVLFSTGKIDVIVDLTSRATPVPEDLNPLFGTI